jgi:hypothetical protein
MAHLGGGKRGVRYGDPDGIIQFAREQCKKSNFMMRIRELRVEVGRHLREVE